MHISAARRNSAIMVVVILAVILLDQLTKHWIVNYFGAPGGRPPISLLGPYLQLIYVQNTGMAFSLLAGQAILVVFLVAPVLVIAGLYWRLRDSASLRVKITFGLILGAAAGNNVLDRFARQYVVDFIHVQIPHLFSFAVFNVADSAIFVGVIGLALLLWRGVPPITGVPRSLYRRTAPRRLKPNGRAYATRICSRGRKTCGGKVCAWGRSVSVGQSHREAGGDARLVCLCSFPPLPRCGVWTDGALRSSTLFQPAPQLMYLDSP